MIPYYEWVSDCQYFDNETEYCYKYENNCDNVHKCELMDED